MRKNINKLFNLPVWTILVLVELFIMLPQLNNQSYILSTVTSKLIFFLYGILVLLGIYTLNLVFSKKINFSYTELDSGLLVLLIYITLNRYFIQSYFGFSIRYIELLGLSFLYVVLRNIGLKSYPWLLLAIVISGIIQAVYGNLQLLGYCPSNHSGFKMTGSFFNPGPYAGFLVSAWSIALGMYLFKDTFINQGQSKIKSNSTFLNKVIQYSFEYVPLLGIISILTVVPATESRAAWISGVVGSLILLELKYHFLIKSFQKTITKLYKITIILVVIGIISIGLLEIYNYKKASSDGRTFIWKVTSEMITDNPIFGMGFDRFRAHYMNYQADYFTVNGETSEALTADTTCYTFNEGLQFAAENGFLGLLLLLIVLLVLFQTKAKENYLKESYILKTGLLTIGVFACFSYPMQILPIKLVLVVFLALLSNLANTSFQVNIVVNKRKLWIFKTSVILLTGVIIYQTLSYTQILKKGFNTWNNAMNNYQYEDYNKVILEFEIAYPVFKKEGEFLMNYGKTLSIAGKPQKAILILEQAKNYQNNTIIATALGDSYKATRQYNKAEANYKQAINMTPSKFYAPYLLAKLYDESKQKGKAVVLAKQILNKKIKVPSTAIEEIKQEMKRILSKY